MGALLVGNRWLPPRSDGWFHAAVTLQIVQRGAPPEDPYFAGLRLLYFWGAHAWAAGWLALAPRLSVYTPLVAFNLAAAFAVVLSVAAIARRLGAGAGGTALATALATLGYTPFGWVFVIARAMLGEVRGWPELVRTAGSGADPLLFTLAYRQLHGSMAFFGDKYLVLTQFSLGLALFALAVLALAELATAPGPRPAIAFGALAASALFVHTVVGYAVVMVAGFVWAACALGALRGDAPARRALVPLALATAAAVLALAPYLLEITLGKRGQFHAGISRASFVTLASGGLFFVLPGFAGLAARARRSGEAGLLLAVSGLLVVLALTLRLPENNQSKFFNLAFLVLAAPAALAWIGLARRTGPAARRALAAFMLAGAVPTVALAIWGFASERGQTAQGWTPPSPAMVEAMAWVRAHTPADAAFCDLGGGRELLTLAGRSVVWGGFYGERNWGYAPEAILDRRELAGALCRGRDPRSGGARLLAGLRREVIVMTRANAPDSLSDHGAVAARPGRFEPLWHNAEVGLWRVR
jgi:hypothetical protein